jgi:steroid 5-alpha reductase family enzyme
MNTASLWLSALPFLLALGLLAWLVATARRNVGLVDIFWSLFFLLAAFVYWEHSAPGSYRAMLVAAVVAVWGLRLAGYLALRNWSAEEDRRYQAIRTRNEPGFAWKSLYLVFLLQATLAWLISAPLAAAIDSQAPLGALDLAGVVVACAGLLFETVADAQLASFKADPANSGRVLNRGLWRYSRHPNYFGEFCLWWGLYLLAAAGGAAWTVFSPLIMTVLLLRVSGVTLLESDIATRRPAYRDYLTQTNAFFPGPRKC